MIPLVLNAAATFALFGLIWTIQLVHYPMFAAVSRDGFVRWHAIHAARISFLVGPLMGLEAATAMLLVLAPPVGVPFGLLALGLALVFVHIAATAFLSVPMHRRLTLGYDAAAIRRLVATNWLRTGVWTARAGLCFYLIAS
jgi:hypothetical protein